MIRPLALAALLLAGCPAEKPAFPHALATAPPRALPDLTLQADGPPVTTASLKGHWTWLYLGYATCPDVCPTTLGKLAAAYKGLKRPDQVRVLFVSVDPRRDTPAGVHKAAAYFHPAFTGAVGNAPALDALTTALGTHYGVQAAKVEHPDLVYVIDPEARFVATYLPDGAIAQDF